MVRPKTNVVKLAWSGRLLSVQPRIRLTRSFDERSHNYLGYVLYVDGAIGDEPGEFRIAVGKGAQKRLGFRAGQKVSGLAAPVPDPRLEVAGYYKASGMKVLKDIEEGYPAVPPYLGLPPDLQTYRSRGHRRLDPRTYGAKCVNCIWGCRMPVELIIDPWDQSRLRYRFETFCYGPKSCAFYRSGRARMVPGRKGSSYLEEDWVDEEATAHRGPDE